MHTMWLLKLTRHDLPALQSLSIHLYLDKTTNYLGCTRTILEHEEILTTLDKLDLLRVFSVKTNKGWMNNEEDGSFFDQERELEMEYDSTMGSLKVLGSGNLSTRGL